MSKDKNKDQGKAEKAVIPAPAPAPAPVEAKPCVAEGKCVTSKRGILSAGEPIKPGDLAGGEEAYKALRDAGYISG